MDYKDKYYKFQEAFQWVSDVINGIPKRVPIYAQLCELIPGEMGKSSRQVFQDPELLNVGTFTVCEKYGIDVPSVDFDCYNIEAEAIGQKLTFHDDIMPDIDRAHSLIQSESDIKKLSLLILTRLPDVHLLLMFIRFLKNLQALRQAWHFAHHSALRQI